MAENTAPQPSSRLRRSTVACQRCRRRKQRCDLAYPQCSACRAAQVECLSFHSAKQREVPRDYTESLEAEVERLKRELAASKTQPMARRDSVHSSMQSSSNAVSVGNTSPEDGQDLITSLALVVMEPSEEPRMLGTSSGLTLARAVLASVGCSFPNPSNRGRTSNDELRPPDLMSSLPPKETAAKLVDIYFQCRTPHFPLFDRQSILSRVRSAYEAHNSDRTSLSGTARRDLFVTFMIFAISLCGVQDGSGGRSAQSEGCYHSALQYLDVMAPSLVNDTESLTNVLLLAQYVSLTPSKGNLWMLVGLALRMSTNLCLHWETEAALGVPQTMLTRRRRLWWVTYWFDRLLVITLGRPMGIEEQSVGAGLPEPSSSPTESSTDRHSQLAANHLVRLAQLETEIKHVVYRQKIKYSLAFPRPDYALWLAEFEPRLREWKSLIPDVHGAHPRSIYACSDWWDATYYNTVILLYRPSPLVTSPSEELLEVCFDASRRVIRCTQALQREQRLEMYWVWVQRLFIAGLTFVYAVWNSEKLRSIEHTQEIVSTAQACSTTLAVLTEKVPSAAGCRDTIESLVTATVNALFETIRQAGPSRETDVPALTQPYVMHISGQQHDIQQYIIDTYSALSEDISGIAQDFGPTSGWSAGLDSTLHHVDPMIPTDSAVGINGRANGGIPDYSPSEDNPDILYSTIY